MDYSFDMTNVEIKKRIQIITKRVENFKVTIELWSTVDGIYNCVEIYNLDTNERIGCAISGTREENIEDTEENMKALKKEQKKLYNYLAKHFDNVEMNKEIYYC